LDEKRRNGEDDGKKMVNGERKDQKEEEKKKEIDHEIDHYPLSPTPKPLNHQNSSFASSSNNNQLPPPSHSSSSQPPPPSHLIDIFCGSPGKKRKIEMSNFNLYFSSHNLPYHHLPSHDSTISQSTIIYKIGFFAPEMVLVKDMRGGLYDGYKVGENER